MVLPILYARFTKHLNVVIIPHTMYVVKRVALCIRGIQLSHYAIVGGVSNTDLTKNRLEARNSRAYFTFWKRFISL